MNDFIIIYKDGLVFGADKLLEDEIDKIREGEISVIRNEDQVYLDVNEDGNFIWKEIPK